MTVYSSEQLDKAGVVGQLAFQQPFSLQVVMNQESQAGVETRTRRPLSVVLPIILLSLMVLARFVPQLWEEGPSWTWAIASFGPTLAGLMLLFVWWLGLSRATLRERVFGFAGCIACIVAASMLLHQSLTGLIAVFTMPIAFAGFGIGLIAVSRSQSPRRVLVGIACCAVAAGATALFRNEGAWGNFSFDLHSRFSESAEDTFLQDLEKRRSATDAAERPSVELPEVAQWPGFRGKDRSGAVVAGDIGQWETPPTELWRKTVGPAWSSVSVAGNYIFTQEQRGEFEATVCYLLSDGTEVWENASEARFFEALGGLGPRATPTFDAGYVYSMGASGLLTKIDALDGSSQWQVDLTEVAKRSAPMWGFSSSPLTTKDAVIVHAGGKDDLGIIAFDIESGDVLWKAPAGEMSYASLQKMSLLGNDYLAILTEVGLELFDESGRAVYVYRWPHTGYRSLQPQVIDEDKVLIPTGQGTGTRLVQFKRDEAGALSAEEIWTSIRLKPDFNDILVYQGNVYGFDGTVFASLSLEDGKLNWKGGRYGKGQALLLEDSGKIIVVTETGELALLDAQGESHQELAKFQALDGRTWNHPVAVNGRLIVRNAAEMVCYEITAQ